jgi:hypothetical protein
MDIRVACLCPAKGHPEGDTVVLRDKLGFHEALTIRKAIALSREDADTGSERALAAEILATLSEFYVLMGVESWTIQDAKGEPLPVTKTNIRGVLMESPDIELVIEAADTIYNEAILLRANPSSPPTPTPSAEPGSSTSATESPTKPQKPSRPSSTTTSRTDGIETITSLPVGGSSSSQSSRSAA